MITDEEVRSIRTDIQALQMKVGALEALLQDKPDLQQRYEKLLVEAHAQLEREQPTDQTPDPLKPSPKRRPN